MPRPSLKARPLLTIEAQAARAESTPFFKQPGVVSPAVGNGGYLSGGYARRESRRGLSQRAKAEHILVEILIYVALPYRREAVIGRSLSPRCFRNRPTQKFRIDRFRQKVVEPARQGPVARMLTTIRRGGHDRHGACSGIGEPADLAYQPEPVLSVHSDVAEHDMRTTFLHQAKRLQSRRSRHDGRTTEAQDGGKVVETAAVIVDDQHVESDEVPRER